MKFNSNATISLLYITLCAIPWCDCGKPKNTDLALENEVLGIIPELKLCFDKLNAQIDELEDYFKGKILEQLDQRVWRNIRKTIQQAAIDQLGSVVANFKAFLKPYLKLHKLFFLLESKHAELRIPAESGALRIDIPEANGINREYENLRSAIVKEKVPDLIYDHLKRIRKDSCLQQGKALPTY